MTKPVIICTEHRGVFYGHAPTDAHVNDPAINLTGAKMAIRWGTTRGLFQLAHTGPTTDSRISAPADITLNKITALLDVTPEAAEAWEKA